MGEKSFGEGEILRLSVEDQKRFADALLNPPPIAPALERAKELHGELVEPSPFQVTKMYNRLSRESGRLAESMAWLALGRFRWVALRCPSCRHDFDLLFNLRSGLTILCPECRHEGLVSGA